MTDTSREAKENSEAAKRRAWEEEEREGECRVAGGEGDHPSEGLRQSAPGHAPPCAAAALLIPDTRQWVNGLQGHANLYTLKFERNLGEHGGITGNGAAAGLNAETYSFRSAAGEGTPQRTLGDAWDHSQLSQLEFYWHLAGPARRCC